MPEIFHPVLTFGGKAGKPVRFEADVFECEVEGTIPPELNGALYRVGGDRAFPSLEGDNIVNGDGLLSMFKIENGHVGFRMRYVKTERLLTERAARKRLYGKYRNKFTDDPSTKGTDRDNTGNTFAFAHHGNLYALREDSHPYRVDPDTLDTLPAEHFNGQLESTSVTAHPKIDPLTGEWWSFGFFARKRLVNDISLHVFDKNGKLVREEFFVAPYPGLVHDWAVTREHLVFPVMPLVADQARIEAGGDFYAYDPDLPGAWGIMPRNGTVKDMRWFNVPHAFIGHVMNAYTEGNVVHVDCSVARDNNFTFYRHVDGSPTNVANGATTITRISFDLGKPDGQAVTVSPFEGALGDMPRLDERYAMAKYRYGYFALRNGRTGTFGIGQLDWDTREMKVHEMPDSLSQEPLFVPRGKDSAEGDGFLLAVVNRHKENRADLVILDGRDVSRPPLATVKLPFNLSFQFHGCFVPG